MEKLKKLLTALRLNYLWSIKGEIALGILGLIVFFKVIGWMQSAGMPVAGLDEGILHFILLAVVSVIGAVVFAFTVINISWTQLDEYIDNEDEKNNQIKDWDKVSFSRDWKATPPPARIFATLIFWSVLFIGFLVALAAAL